MGKHGRGALLSHYDMRVLLEAEGYNQAEEILLRQHIEELKRAHTMCSQHQMTMGCQGQFRSK